jgi:YcxB-like protein
VARGHARRQRQGAKGVTFITASEALRGTPSCGCRGARSGLQQMPLLPQLALRHPCLCTGSCGRFVVEVPSLETPARMVHYELVLDDYHALLKHVCGPNRSERLLWLGAVFIASFGSFAFFRPNRTSFLVGMLVGFVLMLVFVLRAQRRMQPRPGAAVLCRYDVQLTPGGVHIQTPNWTSDIPWHGILAVEETAAHCFFRIDSNAAYLFPKRSFPDGETTRQFIAFAHECVSRARTA